jgi:putative alpha-1,2-mannosidase
MLTNRIISSAIDDEHESVSKTVEYAYDDWCIAQMAKILGKKEDYQYFMKRSQNWKNLYNPKNGFMQPRKNGNWYEPLSRERLIIIIRKEIRGITPTLFSRIFRD